MKRTGRIGKRIKKILEQDRCIQEHLSEHSARTMIIPEGVIVLAFFGLSAANLAVGSMTMFWMTLAGTLLTGIAIIVTANAGNRRWGSHLSILGCAILFTVFTITGGNDGFAILWVVLFPGVSMLAFDFRVGFLVSTYFQIFLCAAFWTPMHTWLPYCYTEVFLLRFPLLYATSFLLSVYLAIFLKKNQYDLLMKSEQLLYEKDYDRMTGVYNRSKYETMLANGFSDCRTIGVLFFDVDYLKRTNDAFGHSAGDRILIQTAEQLKCIPEENKLIFRIGGDEFIVVLPDCREGACEAFLERWKQAKEQTEKKFPPPIPFSVAYGYCYGKEGYDISQVIDHADQNMYLRKKENKKNE